MLNQTYLYQKQQKESKSSILFNEKTFYRTFVDDILKAKSEVIICSPFITKFRSDFFRSTFQRLKNRNVSIFIFTRPLEEHDYLQRDEISGALSDYEDMGASVITTSGNVHEKVAIIDREILWEGSLNILSQRSSRELMRRSSDKDSAMEVMRFLGLNKKLIESYKLKYERLCRSLKDDSDRSFKLKMFFFFLGMVIVLVGKWLFIVFKAIMMLLYHVISIISFIINRR